MSHTDKEQIIIIENVSSKIIIFSQIDKFYDPQNCNNNNYYYCLFVSVVFDTKYYQSK